jgi:hypothetical protein
MIYSCFTVEAMHVSPLELEHGQLYVILIVIILIDEISHECERWVSVLSVLQCL